MTLPVPARVLAEHERAARRWLAVPWLLVALACDPVPFEVVPGAAAGDASDATAYVDAGEDVRLVPVRARGPASAPRVESTTTGQRGARATPTPGAAPRFPLAQAATESGEVVRLDVATGVTLARFALADQPLDLAWESRRSRLLVVVPGSAYEDGSRVLALDFAATPRVDAASDLFDGGASLLVARARTFALFGTDTAQLSALDDLDPHSALTDLGDLLDATLLESPERLATLARGTEPGVPTLQVAERRLDGEPRARATTWPSSAAGGARLAHDRSRLWVVARQSPSAAIEIAEIDQPWSGAPPHPRSALAAVPDGQLLGAAADAERGLFVLLIGGATNSTLAVTRGDGAPLFLHSLPAPTEPDPRHRAWLRRDLALEVGAGQALAATARGVFALSYAADALQQVWARDELRGPVVLGP